MIVVDIETSGLDCNTCGIIELAALELEHPDNVFFETARLDATERSEAEALRIIGKTEQELRDANRQTQKELLSHFFQWASTIQIKTCICQNPQFDLVFIQSKAKKYQFYPENYPLHHRAFDLHSIAAFKYYLINNRFLIDEEKSGMNLDTILALCGMRVIRTVHTALEDVTLTAECFSRIVFGKKLLKEFDTFEIPSHLHHDNL